MINRYLIRYSSVMIFLILLFGCAHQVTLNPTISPSSFTVKKYPYRVAVVFSPDMLELVVHATPTSFIGGGHVYDFQMGDSLCQALLRSADAAYNEVVQADLDLKEGEFDRIIKYSLANSNLNIEFTGAFTWVTAKGNYSLSVLMEAFDGQNLSLIQKAPINGSGFVSQHGNEFTSDKIFAKAIEQGIQQVSDNAANLLASGFGEIR
ncbi:MAG: hypothetical protein Q8M54_06545 [Desulfobaccales bacterium]|nr:hypothetical protein [Desulfobaccales bacterium]